MTSWLVLADRQHGDHMDGGWALMMALFMILLLVAVALLVIWLVRGTSFHPVTPARETPMEVLDRRLASGEITPDEYRERAEILRGR